MAGDSKTEKATPKKRRDERKKGNIFMSQDVISVVVLAGSFFLIKLLFPYLYRTAAEYLQKCAEQTAVWTDNSVEGMQLVLGELLLTGMKMVLPILLVCALLAIVATGAQTKFLFTAENFRPKFSRLSPLQGIKKIFSFRNIFDLLKNLLKISILAVLVWQMFQEDMVRVIRMMDMSVKVSSVHMLNMVMSIVLKVSMVFVAVAGFDYLYQWWDYERRLRMSKQELKEEYKQTEGNPEIKGRIRDIQRQRARMRMMQAVPQADVIIRNPTHFAVALKYNMDSDNAPVVLAKGQDELALRIVKKGEESGVAIIENKPLARALYAQTAINQEIPAEYYGMVAEILVYVYQIKQKKAERS